MLSSWKFMETVKMRHEGFALGASTLLKVCAGILRGREVSVYHVSEDVC